MFTSRGDAGLWVRGRGGGRPRSLESRVCSAAHASVEVSREKKSATSRARFFHFFVVFFFCCCFFSFFCFFQLLSYCHSFFHCFFFQVAALSGFVGRDVGAAP